MKRIIFIFLLSISITTGIAQVAINSSAAIPAASSMLDISSTNKGVLLPRMTSAQRKAIPSPEIGLLVYDVERQTVYLFDGAKWKPFMVASENNVPLVSRTPTNVYPYGSFGKSVAIYGDYAIVGAPTDSAAGIFSGTAYIYAKINGTWLQQAKIHPTGGTAGDMFGVSVAIRDDIAVIGAPDKTVSGMIKRGRVYIFKRTGVNWSMVTSVIASNGMAEDYFGSAVSFNGQYIFVGAPYTNHSSKENAGSAYIFGLQNNIWTQKAVLVASDPASFAYFGKSVDLYGTTAVVGAPWAVSNNVYTGNVPMQTGAAYIYNNTDLNGFTWAFNKRITQDVVGSDFGASVSIDGNTLLIGMPRNQMGNVDQGYVLKYTKVLGNWEYDTANFDGEAGYLQGWAVAVDGDDVYYAQAGWNNGKGRVVLGLDVTTRKFFYDDESDAYRTFGVNISAHNGQFIINATGSFLLDTRNGSVFFGSSD